MSGLKSLLHAVLRHLLSSSPSSQKRGLCTDDNASSHRYFYLVTVCYSGCGFIFQTMLNRFAGDILIFSEGFCQFFNICSVGCLQILPKDSDCSQILPRFMVTLTMHSSFNINTCLFHNSSYQTWDQFNSRFDGQFQFRN